jgi:hypothetical protein
MKYAITGPRGRILQVLDAPTDGAVEITDKQAVTVNSSESPLYLIDGELKSEQEFVESRLSPEQLAAFQAAKNSVPQSMTAWQARAILEMEGLLTQVESAIAELDEGPVKIIIKSAWENNADFKRDSLAIEGISKSIGLTSEQVDELFIKGASLTV